MLELLLWKYWLIFLIKSTCPHTGSNFHSKNSTGLFTRDTCTATRLRELLCISTIVCKNFTALNTQWTLFYAHEFDKWNRITGHLTFFHLSIFVAGQSRLSSLELQEYVLLLTTNLTCTLLWRFSTGRLRQTEATTSNVWDIPRIFSTNLLLSK
jgi:hypothetical protein